MSRLVRRDILSRGVKIRSVLKSCKTHDQAISVAQWASRLLVKDQFTQEESLYILGMLNAIRVMDRVVSKND